MNTFKYIAIDSRGKRTEGTVAGLALEDAKRDVKKMGLRILELSQIKIKTTTRRKFTEINLTPPKVKPESLIRFFRQLATMLNAGIQLIDALEILELQSRLHDKLFAKALSDITQLVQSGVPFSSALKEHKNIFSKMVTSMIRAAEVGGGLDKIIDHIAAFIEKEADTKKKIKSATSYPKFVGGFFMLILLGIVFGLLPIFEDIFSNFGATLPAPTRVILATSNFLKSNILIIVVVSIGLIIGYKAYSKTEKGRLFLDQHLFDIPVAGNYVQKSVLIRFTITLSILMKSGVGLIEGLKIAAQTAENTYVDKIVGIMCDRIAEGDSFGRQLSQYPEIFPLLESSMIAVGEKSGSLNLMLDKVAEFNDQEFSSKVENLSNVLEPAIMGFLGIVATILVLGLYLPIFKMSGAIH